MKGHNEKCISIFQKYNNYNKDIVQLSIDTLSGEERIILKKRYGESYLGTGYILKSEEAAYEDVERKLLIRLKEVDELIQNGKTKQQILDYYLDYNKKSSFSYYSSYTKYSSQIMNNKLGNSFIENFPILIRSVIKKILPQMSVEEKSLVNLFYWGYDYDVLRKDIDNDKIKDLKALINKLKDDAIKIYQHKATIHNHNTLKESTKTNITTNNPKKIANINIKNNNSLQKKIKSRKLYEEKDQETVLKIIDRFKVTNPDYYEIISKKYSGDKFEIKNDVDLTYEEQKLFNSAKAKIKLLLNDSKKLDIFLGAQEGFLKLYEEKYQETVLKIVNRFKVTSPDYYEVISKKYSGDKFEIKNDVELTYEEQKLFNSAKAKIKILLNDSKKLNIFLSAQNGFLQLYEEKDQETVLKIVDMFKVMNPNYYEIISKKYSGDRFEIKNVVKLTKKEHTIFSNAKVRINSLLTDKQKLIILLAEKQDLILEKQEFKCKFDEKNLNLYISNLDKISNESAIEVINQIAKYYPNKIIDIINSNYIKNKLNYLTQKEQAYIYLNLLSYNIPSLTKKKISQILDVEELFLDEYQIMTSNDDVNELNKLIKK